MDRLEQDEDGCRDDPDGGTGKNTKHEQHQELPPARRQILGPEKGTHGEDDPAFEHSHDDAPQVHGKGQVGPRHRLDEECLERPAVQGALQAAAETAQRPGQDSGNRQTEDGECEVVATDVSRLPDQLADEEGNQDRQDRAELAEDERHRIADFLDDFHTEEGNRDRRCGPIR